MMVTQVPRAEPNPTVGQAIKLGEREWHRILSKTRCTLNHPTSEGDFIFAQLLSVNLNMVRDMMPGRQTPKQKVPGKLGDIRSNYVVIDLL